MRLRRSLFDWWGRSYHTRRMYVVEAALIKAGDRGMSNHELAETTEFSHWRVNVAIRKLKREGRVKEMSGRYYRDNGQSR